jgi:hypothetical protein
MTALHLEDFSLVGYIFEAPYLCLYSTILLLDVHQTFFYCIKNKHYENIKQINRGLKLIL